MVDLIFIDKFEELLEKQYLTANNKNRRAYICSPLRADNAEGMLLNMRAAKAYMYYAIVKMGLPARAPHAFLPMLLYYTELSERNTALHFGLELLEISDILLVCGNRISSEMQREITHAALLDKKIRVFNKSILGEAKRIIAEAPYPYFNKIILDKSNSFMSLSGPDVFASSWDWDTGGGA